MIKTLLITLLCWLTFGIILLPWERHIVMEEKVAHLLIPPPPEGTADALEQQLSIVSLGGLRSLVAAFLNIEAFDAFRTKNWVQLERRYRQIVTLAPHNPYYWDIGSWHLAYNAASSTKEDKKLSRAEQRKGHKDYIARGKSFLQQGIDNNPDDWLLYSKLGNMLSDPLRYPDYSAAAQAYQKSRQLGGSDIIARQEFYTRSRIPDQSAQAWQLGKKLFQEPENRQPSLVSTLFALQNKLNLPEAQRIPFHQLFPSDSLAIRYLRLQLKNGLGYPIDGVRAKLDELIEDAKH